MYQAIWFGSVLAQNYFLLPVILLLGLHFYLCDNRRDEVIAVILCAIFGLVGDTLLTQAGVFSFAPALMMFAVPWWLVAIWLGFASTLRHGLTLLVNRPPMAVLAAGIGAPVVYLAAARLGAVQFPMGSVKTAMIVSAVWMLQMGLFLLVLKAVSRISSTEREETPMSIS